MIDYQLYCKIRHMNQQDGLTARQIARHLAMDVRTVKNGTSKNSSNPEKARISKMVSFFSQVEPPK